MKQAAADAENLLQLHPTHAGYRTLKAHVDFHRDESHLEACIQTLEALPDDDLTLPGAERWFLLAMALHKRKHEGDLQRAQEAFERAVKQMKEESPGDVSLIELRDEAAILLGISTATEAGAPAPKEAPLKAEDRKPPEPPPEAQESSAAAKPSAKEPS